MTPLSSREKRTLLYLVPLLLLGAFAYWIYFPHARTHARLETACTQLPDPEQFPLLRKSLLTRVEKAQHARDAARARTPPEQQVLCENALSPNARLQNILTCFLACGLRLKGIAPCTENQTPSKAPDLLRAAGLTAPCEARHIQLLSNDVHLFQRALTELKTRKCAALIESLSLTYEDTSCVWAFTLWF